MISKRSYVIRVMLTALALIGPNAIFLLSIDYLNWRPQRWMSSLVILFSVALMFEVASHYQISARQGPVAGVLKKYPATRDRIVFLVAAIVFLVIYFLTLSLEGLPFLPAVVLILLGGLLAYGICVNFGTRVLREGVALKVFERANDDTPRQ